MQVVQDQNKELRRNSRSKDLKLNLINEKQNARRKSKDSSLETIDTSSARKEIFLDNINTYLVNSGMKGANRHPQKENVKPNISKSKHKKNDPTAKIDEKR